MIRIAARSAVTLALSLITAVAVLPSTPAGAWGNGGSTADAPDERDGYGTHDWVVDMALKTAGPAGSWLDASEARLFTDDPDRLGRVVDPELDAEHLFREIGTGRGAVHVISEHYNEAIAAHKAGNLTEASRQFGLLSHHYSDIMQPYHAAYAGLGEDTLHRDYEKQVDAEIKDANDGSRWYVRRTAAEVTNIRKHAIAAAAYSRSKFSSLHSAFSASRDIRNSTVDAVTKLVLSRASNDLGDILATIPTHKGRAPGLDRLSSRVKIRYIGQNQYQGVYITAKGTDGRVIEGLPIDVAWPKPEGGTITERIYTMPDGTAKLARNVGDSPLMVRRGVKSTATTGTRTRETATWWMATPKLADGSKGFSANPSDYTPHTYVAIKAKTIDRYGNPVEGLKVKFTWKFKTGTVRTYDKTNSNGVAVTKKDISRAANGYTVYVYTHVQSGGYNRYYKTKFTP